nr:DHH family phosphoesterase [Bacteriovoracaceae bacterium]
MQLSSVSEENKLLPASMLRLLGGRNLSPVDVTNLFSWNLQELPELCALKDLEKSSQRIIKALEQNEKIGIYGDYDVDGTTSCALFYHFFQMLNVTPYLFQPSRFVEGYGLHVSSIEHALEKEIKILITVDCGISSHEAAFFAKDKNIDLIITDHHTDGALEIPVAFAVVNPNRQDEDKNSPLKALAGVGVAFALCVQIKKDLEKKGKTIPSLYPLLQFVAIGTICDMAPLTPLNLKLVRHGLKQIPKSSYQGILSFFPPEEREVDVMSSEKISFNVGPLINSKGRIDH